MLKATIAALVKGAKAKDTHALEDEVVCVCVCVCACVCVLHVFVHRYVRVAITDIPCAFMSCEFGVLCPSGRS